MNLETPQQIFPLHRGEQQSESHAGYPDSLRNSLTAASAAQVCDECRERQLVDQNVCEGEFVGRTEQETVDGKQQPRYGNAMFVNNNILEKSGSWFSYKSERIGQGRENARQFLKDNKDVMAKLDAEVRKALGLAHGPAQPAAAARMARGSSALRISAPGPSPAADRARPTLEEKMVKRPRQKEKQIGAAGCLSGGGQRGKPRCKTRSRRRKVERASL